ncbi:helix-turn-helix transcriptional regulator, partial [Streptomyces parvus]|uniref:helix-turn-helix transcriptional regulator n=1 Tax=Streptomyces parvus TaxID=66428 RepID=UPI003647C2A2
MSKRPEFPIAQITEQFEISRSTLRRGLNDGRFPNAKKDHHGRWLIPVDDVLQAGKLRALDPVKGGAVRDTS